MAKSLDDERAAIAADEERLADRRKRLAERERDAALAALDKAGLLKLPLDRIEAFVAQVKKLGFEEVTKRLAA